MAKTLGWLTVTGLALIASAIVAQAMEAAHHLPIILLCLGGGCFLFAGIPWAHTRGKRELKIVFFGVVGFAGGGAAGVFLGDSLGNAVALKGADGVGTVLLAVFVCFWIGAILFCWLGVRWGISIHSRSGPDGTGVRSGVDLS